MTPTIWLIFDPNDARAAQTTRQYLEYEEFVCRNADYLSQDVLTALDFGVLLLSSRSNHNTAIIQQIHHLVRADATVVILRLEPELELSPRILPMLPGALVIDAYGIPKLPHLRCLRKVLHDRVLLADLTTFHSSAQTTENVEPVAVTENQTPAQQVVAEQPAEEPSLSADEIIAQFPHKEALERREMMSRLREQLEARYQKLKMDLAQHLQQGNLKLARQTVAVMLRLKPTNRDLIAVQQDLYRQLEKQDRRRGILEVGMWPFLKGIAWGVLVLAALWLCYDFFDDGNSTRLQVWVTFLILSLVTGFVAYVFQVYYALRAVEEASPTFKSLSLYGHRYVRFLDVVVLTIVLLYQGFKLDYSLAWGIGLFTGMLFHVVARANRAFGVGLFKHSTPLAWCLFGIAVLVGALLNLGPHTPRLVTLVFGVVFFLPMLLGLCVLVVRGTQEWFKKLSQSSPSTPTSLWGDSIYKLCQLESLYEGFEYDIFISYRHQHLDKRVAEELHRTLESYSTPFNISERGFPTHIRRVFVIKKSSPFPRA